MSNFKTNLQRRMAELGYTVATLHAKLAAHGSDVAYSTVAGWMNANRGVRWKAEDLALVLKVLRTDLQTLIHGEQRIRPLDVDTLAQTIRQVDGRHTLGAAALAEAILASLGPLGFEQQA